MENKDRDRAAENYCETKGYGHLSSFIAGWDARDAEVSALKADADRVLDILNGRVGELEAVNERLKAWFTNRTIHVFEYEGSLVAQLINDHNGKPAYIPANCKLLTTAREKIKELEAEVRRLKEREKPLREAWGPAGLKAVSQFIEERDLEREKSKNLEAEIERLREDMSGRICGYCWDKMYDEGYPTLADQLTREREISSVLEEALQKYNVGNGFDSVAYKALAKIEEMRNEPKQS